MCSFRFILYISTQFIFVYVYLCFLFLLSLCLTDSQVYSFKMSATLTDYYYYYYYYYYYSCCCSSGLDV